MTSLATRVRLKTIQAYDRFRLRQLRERHPGFRLHPEASTNFASSHFELAPGAKLEIGARVYTERSAEVGSSNKMASGRIASARAMATRCC